MIIKIPNDNLVERAYIIDIIFECFLDITYKIEIDSSVKNWEIILKNGNKLIFEDSFFHKYKEDLEYLKLENIPQEIKFVENKFIVENNIPIIYGNEKIIEKFSESSKILFCGIDIFASSFFMLSRWEEHVKKVRDNHKRFPGVASLAYQNSFLQRPVVNEYLEMLKNMLSELGLNEEIKDRSYNLYMSCDVDEPFDCTVKSIFKLVKACGGDIIKRKSIFLSFKRVQKYINNILGNYKYDQNYTFDWYMDICESINAKITFYFIPVSIEDNNACYDLEDKNIEKLLTYIDSRGHEIGVHGSYQTYQDGEKAKKQKKILEKTLNNLGINQTIKGNRQHYLRWDSAKTPTVLDYAGFEYDSTGFYADRFGFRHGVCYEFEMFDFLNRKHLNIKQRPLIVMDCTIIDQQYMGYGFSDKAFSKILDIKNKCVKYNGDFSILWHNNYFFSEEHKKMFESFVTGELK